MVDRNKEGLKKEYDFSLAVTARRVLKIEFNPLRICYELAYNPKKELLEELVRKGARAITFFCNGTYSWQMPKGFVQKTETGQCVDVYFIGQDNRIAYFGTIIDKTEAVAMWEKHLRIHRNDKNKIGLLIKTGYMAISNEISGCYIPVNSDCLDVSSIEKGIRRYLENFHPGLRDIAIKWLSEDKRLVFLRIIHKESRKSAKHQTTEEKNVVIKEDL